MNTVDFSKLVIVDGLELDENLAGEIGELLGEEMAYFFDDNGGDTDGNSYFISADDLNEKETSILIQHGATPVRLAILNANYNDDENGYDLSGHNWTGWDVNGHAYIEVPADYSSPLLDVMTSAEVSQTYGIADATVRQTILRGALPARKSGSTWLIGRSDAEMHWGGKRK